MVWQHGATAWGTASASTGLEARQNATMSSPCWDSRAILSSALANRRWRSMSNSLRLSGQDEDGRFLPYPRFRSGPSVEGEPLGRESVMTQTNHVQGSPPPLTIVQPGEREVTGDLGGIGVAFKLWGRDTNGMVSVVEHPFAVGALVEPHLHTREDEYSIVTEGQIGFRSGSREVVLGPGGYITKPRGEVHAMWNAGSVPARMIEIISPAGLENFFREVAELIAAAAPPDLTQLVALAETYGVQFGEPDWLPDIIDRYKLNPSS